MEAGTLIIFDGILCTIVCEDESGYTVRPVGNGLIRSSVMHAEPNEIEVVE